VLTLIALAGCATPETKTLLQPSHALCAVLDEEAAQAAGAKKQVALSLPDANWGPASAIEEVLKAELNQRCVTAVTAKAADLGDPTLRDMMPNQISTSSQQAWLAGGASSRSASTRLRKSSP
jgi:hypothetical protein